MIKGTNMSYSIESKPASKNGYHTPAQAKAYYGKYNRTGITVHWWGDPKLNPDKAHDNIVSYIRGKASKGVGSVNYVLSNTKITMLVHPDNVAWASQGGNPTTVSIEFSPHLNSEGYKKAGWLIWQLEKRYGRKLTLYPHKYWFSTACPGSLSLNRMRDEANKWAKGAYNPKPKPTPKPSPKPTPAPTGPKLTWEKLKKPVVHVVNKPTAHLWDFNSRTWNMKPVKSFKKGDKITVYGKCKNETLGATYLLTEYSYNKKITNGFNQADLDVYVAPQKPTAPAPKPPDSQTPVKPPAIEPPVPAKESAFDQRLSVLEKIVQAIVDALAKIGIRI